MERTVTVVPEAGLHARPASKLVQTVNRFDAEVSIGRARSDDDEGDDSDGDDGDENNDDDGLVRADSMLSVSGLNVAHGESVRVVAEGPDAEDALDAVCELLTTTVEPPDDDHDNGDTGGETE